MHIAPVQFRGSNSLAQGKNGKLHSEVVPQTQGQSIKHMMNTFKEGTSNIQSTIKQRGSPALDSGLIQSVFTVAASNR